MYWNNLINLGFKHCALETVYTNSDSLIDIKMDSIKGFYLRSPTFYSSIKFLYNKGYKVHGYDFESQNCTYKSQNSNVCRDSMQAINIKKIIERFPNEKIIVYGGHAHTYFSGSSWKTMAMFLKDMYPNKNIISLNQINYIDSFGKDNTYFEILNKENSVDYPVIVDDLIIKHESFNYNILHPNKALGYWFNEENVVFSQKIDVEKYKNKYIEITEIDCKNGYSLFKRNVDTNHIFLPVGKYKINERDNFFNLINN